MKTVLVVDDLAIYREPIAAILCGAGYEVVCAATGKEALAALISTRFDLILLDLNLPDIGGLRILQSLRRTASTAQVPVILLTAEEGRDVIIKAKKLGAQGYLLKSKFSLKDMLARIEQHSTPVSKPPTEATIAAPINDLADRGSVPQLLTREQFLQRVESTMQAKTLSGVVAQVISLAASPRTELAELAAVVSRDTVLATRVLQAANSAAYRSANGSVTTISDATRQVGCSTVRNIASAVGIFQAMPETSSDGFNPIRCWQHSFAVAQLCEILAAAGGHNSGVAYLVGLCHDLGEIVLRTQFGAEYRQVIDAEKRTGRPREELELLMLGMTHGDLVSTVLRAFGLPDAVRAPIEWFHGTHSTSLGSPSTLEGVLRIAEWYANGVLLAASESAHLNLLTSAQCKAAVGTATPPRPGTEKLRGEIMALTGMLARLSPSEEAELMKPLLPQADKHIWVARSTSFSSLDPVAAAIDCLSHAQMKDRLPTAAEMAHLDGLVILGDDAMAATALQPSPSILPTLRIMSASAERLPPDSIRCPVTLGQLSNFCSTLAPSRAAA